MGNKGKGRGSAKATYAWDIGQQVRNTVEKQRRRSTTASNSTANDKQRPRLTIGLGQLRNLLKERRQYENYEWLQQRRRAGFLPPQKQTNLIDTTSKKIVSTGKPLGSLLLLLDNNDTPLPAKPPLLQNLCLNTLGEYFSDYLEAMGVDEFHTALSLLPSESLAKLSVIVSKTCGMNNQIAFCIGKHSHVEALCLRPSSSDNNNNNNKRNNKFDNDDDEDDTLFFTDEGLLNIIPSEKIIPNNNDTTAAAAASWEDLLDDDYDCTATTTVTAATTIDDNFLIPPSRLLFRLKRLELVDCTLLTINGILLFLEQCPFITHLSLTGCLNQQQYQQQEEQGGKIEADFQFSLIQSLPNLLPALQVLDVTRCFWMNSILVKELRKEYSKRGQPPPVVYFQQQDSSFHDDNDGFW